MTIEFSRNLIKGRIAEVIFEQMIREEDRYTVIPFGYEHTMPLLAQYRHLIEVEHVINNIADAPDFALLSSGKIQDKTKLYLVEVKYQKTLNIEELKKHAGKLKERWEYPWLFVATSEGFYCGMCRDVLDRNEIKLLPESWVTADRQKTYLKLLNEFER